MKLKKFENKSERYELSIPHIHISGKSGLISLSAVCAAKLGLGKDDSISFYQDEDSMIDWFIKKETGDNTFRLRTYKSGAMSFNCSKLARKMLTSMIGGSKERTSCKLTVSGTPWQDGYYAILAHSQKKEK